jgi:hypothetical protein
MSDYDDISALQKAVGPKRVKTPTHEIEQYSLREMLAASEKLKKRPIGLSAMHFDIVTPKEGCTCEDTRSKLSSGCSRSNLP